MYNFCHANHYYIIILFQMIFSHSKYNCESIYTEVRNESIILNKIFMFIILHIEIGVELCFLSSIIF